MLTIFVLFAPIRPHPGVLVIDLGCGTGELTAMLADRLPDARVEGVDASVSMLTQATPRARGRPTFRQVDIRTIENFSPHDLVFPNAVPQWVPDADMLLARHFNQLRPGAGRHPGATLKQASDQLHHGTVAKEPPFHVCCASPYSAVGC